MHFAGNTRFKDPHKLISSQVGRATAGEKAGHSPRATGVPTENTKVAQHLGEGKGPAQSPPASRWQVDATLQSGPSLTPRLHPAPPEHQTPAQAQQGEAGVLGGD